MDGIHVDSAEARQRARMTERDFKAVARLGVDGAEREIIRRMNDEQRASTGHERGIVADVKARGGVCRPDGMTQEEWANRLPRALRGGRKHCARVDELAQEFADRGMTSDAYQDTALDFLAVADVVSKTKAAPADPKELRKAARKLIDSKATRAAADLIASSQQLRCDLPKGEPMKGMHGIVRERGVAKTGAGMGSATSLIRRYSTGKAIQFGERAAVTGLCIFALSQSETIVPKVFFGAATAFFGLLTIAKAFEM